MSQNVSEGQTAEFTCVSTNGHATITWTTEPNVELVTRMNSNLPSGGTKSLFKFKALAKNNHTTVTCFIFYSETNSVINHGLLLVQGSINTLYYLDIKTKLFRSLVWCW